MTFGTKYGTFKCKICGEHIYFNEPDHWYSDVDEQFRDEYREILEHIKKCQFEYVDDCYATS